MSARTGASGRVVPTVHDNVRREGAGNRRDEAILRCCDRGSRWLLCVRRLQICRGGKKGTRGQTQETDNRGENKRPGVLKSTAEGQVEVIEIQTEYAEEEEKSICMQEVLMHRHTHTHTSTHLQPDGAVCRACPIKLHPLVKKIYGSNAPPQPHKNTNTQLQGTTLLAQQQKVSYFLSLSYTLTQTCTDPNCHHLFYFLPQQMQDAEECGTRLSAHLIVPAFSFFLFSFHVLWKNSGDP